MGKLGLSIIGGSEHASRVFGGGRPGVYISKVSHEPEMYTEHRITHACTCMCMLMLIRLRHLAYLPWICDTLYMYMYVL